MAQAKFVTLLTETTGLNNVLDPVRLSFDPKTGVTELARAVNVDIDDSGRISRRLGRTLKRAEASGSAFADGETCLFIAGTALFKLNPDFSRTGLRSGLTAGAPMSFWPVADRVYYTNGFENGYVKGTTSHAWRAPDEYNGPRTNRTFDDPPVGHLICWFGGRMLVAKDNAIFASEVTQYGRFDLAKNYKLEAERITLLRPVTGGLFVGTANKVVYYEGETFDKLTRLPRTNYGALEGSDDKVLPETLGLEGEGEFCLFTTTRGICLGGPGGLFRNLTESKLTLPSARRACGRVVGGRYLVLIQP